jgi:hypothetical protein
VIGHQARAACGDVRVAIRRDILDAIADRCGDVLAEPV